MTVPTLYRNILFKPLTGLLNSAVFGKYYGYLTMKTIIKTTFKIATLFWVTITIIFSKPKF